MSVKVGCRVAYGVPPGIIREYRVAKVGQFCMVTLERWDARLGRMVVIDVYEDEVRPV